MNWRCRLGHPFELGLYITTTPKKWIDDSTYYLYILKCKYCNYLHDGIRRIH